MDKLWISLTKETCRFTVPLEVALLYYMKLGEAVLFFEELTIY
jgi:hypothetical protein